LVAGKITAGVVGVGVSGQASGPGPPWKRWARREIASERSREPSLLTSPFPGKGGGPASDTVEVRTRIKERVRKRSMKEKSLQLLDTRSMNPDP
jgi:hypothetical protein